MVDKASLILKKAKLTNELLSLKLKRNDILKYKLHATDEIDIQILLLSNSLVHVQIMLDAL